MISASVNIIQGKNMITRNTLVTALKDKCESVEVLNTPLNNQCLVSYNKNKWIIELDRDGGSSLEVSPFLSESNNGNMHKLVVFATTDNEEAISEKIIQAIIELEKEFY